MRSPRLYSTCHVSWRILSCIYKWVSFTFVRPPAKDGIAILVHNYNNVYMKRKNTNFIIHLCLIISSFSSECECIFALCFWLRATSTRRQHKKKKKERRLRLHSWGYCCVHVAIFDVKCEERREAREHPETKLCSHRPAFVFTHSNRFSSLSQLSLRAVNQKKKKKKFGKSHRTTWLTAVLLIVAGFRAARIFRSSGFFFFFSI